MDTIIQIFLVIGSISWVVWSILFVFMWICAKMEGKGCDECPVRLNHTQKTPEATPAPSKSIFREKINLGPNVCTHPGAINNIFFHKCTICHPEQKTQEQLFICRKVKFGKNGNFIRYQEIDNTGHNLKKFMTQFDGVKLRKFD